MHIYLKVIAICLVFIIVVLLIFTKDKTHDLEIKIWDLRISIKKHDNNR